MNEEVETFGLDGCSSPIVGHIPAWNRSSSGTRGVSGWIEDLRGQENVAILDLRQESEYIGWSVNSTEGGHIEEAYDFPLLRPALAFQKALLVLV